MKKQLILLTILMLMKTLVFCQTTYPNKTVKPNGDTVIEITPFQLIKVNKVFADYDYCTSELSNEKEYSIRKDSIITDYKVAVTKLKELGVISKKKELEYIGLIAVKDDKYNALDKQYGKLNKDYKRYVWKSKIGLGVTMPALAIGITFLFIFLKK